MSEYFLEIDRIAAGVCAVSYDKKHAALLSQVRLHPILANAELVHVEDGFESVAQSVYSAEGELVSRDHRAWLSEQFVLDGARPGHTFKRIADAQYWLSHTVISYLYIVTDRGGLQQNFLQTKIAFKQEFKKSRVFTEQSAWLTPRSSADLVELAGSTNFPEEQLDPVGKPLYEYVSTVDVAIFVSMAESLETERREAMAKRAYSREDASGAVVERGVMADLDPDYAKYPPKQRRIFDDWARSSAGASGARICRSWVFSLNDWKGPGGGRELTLVPMWTHTKKLAEVKSKSLSDQALYDKLTKLSGVVGVPFGWYFFMLHGNRVHEGSGHRILQAAKSGLVDLPECDLRVLEAWANREYGF